jgi:hypothetical protein
MLIKMEDARHVSYSQYAMYSQCPWYWKLTYHDNLRPDEDSIHLIFGSAMHEVIQDWLTLLFNEPPIKAKVFDLNEALKLKLSTLFKDTIKTDVDGNKTYICDATTLQEFYIDGCAILDYLRKNIKEFFPTKGYKLLGVEIPLEVSLNPFLKFVGYLDIVIQDKKTKKVHIYDLKTATKGWHFEKKDAKKTNQLLLYKAFYSEQFGIAEDDIDITFVILKRRLGISKYDKRIVGFVPSHGPPSLKKAKESFQTFISNTFDMNGQVIVENLKPNPSEQACRFCPFRNDATLCSASYYNKQPNSPSTATMSSEQA